MGELQSAVLEAPVGGASYAIVTRELLKSNLALDAKAFALLKAPILIGGAPAFGRSFGGHYLGSDKLLFQNIGAADAEAEAEESGLAHMSKSLSKIMADLTCPRACCRAMSPSCLACSACQTVED